MRFQKIVAVLLAVVQLASAVPVRDFSSEALAPTPAFFTPNYLKSFPLVHHWGVEKLRSAPADVLSTRTILWLALMVIAALSGASPEMLFAVTGIGFISDPRIPPAYRNWTTIDEFVQKMNQHNQWNFPHTALQVYVKQEISPAHKFNTRSVGLKQNILIDPEKAEEKQNAIQAEVDLFRRFAQDEGASGHLQSYESAKKWADASSLTRIAEELGLDVRRLNAVIRATRQIPAVNFSIPGISKGLHSRLISRQKTMDVFAGVGREISDNPLLPEKEAVQSGLAVLKEWQSASDIIHEVEKQTGWRLSEEVMIVHLRRLQETAGLRLYPLRHLTGMKMNVVSPANAQQIGKKIVAEIHRLNSFSAEYLPEQRHLSSVQEAQSLRDRYGVHPTRQRLRLGSHALGRLVSEGALHCEVFTLPGIDQMALYADVKRKDSHERVSHILKNAEVEKEWGVDDVVHAFHEKAGWSLAPKQARFMLYHARQSGELPKFSGGILGGSLQNRIPSALAREWVDQWVKKIIELQTFSRKVLNESAPVNLQDVRRLQALYGPGTSTPDSRRQRAKEFSVPGWRQKLILVPPNPDFQRQKMELNDRLSRMNISPSARDEMAHASDHFLAGRASPAWQEWMSLNEIIDDLRSRLSWTFTRDELLTAFPEKDVRIDVSPHEMPEWRVPRAVVMVFAINQEREIQALSRVWKDLGYDDPFPTSMEDLQDRIKPWSVANIEHRLGVSVRYLMRAGLLHGVSPRIAGWRPNSHLYSARDVRRLENERRKQLHSRLVKEQSTPAETEKHIRKTWVSVESLCGILKKWGWSVSRDSVLTRLAPVRSEKVMHLERPGGDVDLYVHPSFANEWLLQQGQALQTLRQFLKQHHHVSRGPSNQAEAKELASRWGSSATRYLLGQSGARMSFENFQQLQRKESWPPVLTIDLVGLPPSYILYGSVERIWRLRHGASLPSASLLSLADRLSEWTPVDFPEAHKRLLDALRQPEKEESMSILSRVHFLRDYLGNVAGYVFLASGISQINEMNLDPARTADWEEHTGYLIRGSLAYFLNQKKESFLIVFRHLNPLIRRFVDSFRKENRMSSGDASSAIFTANEAILFLKHLRDLRRNA